MSPRLSDDLDLPELPYCGLCEREVVVNQPCTFVLAATRRHGIVKLPVHLACFGKLIAGEVARELRDVLAGAEPGGMHYENGHELHGTLAVIVERLAEKYL